MGRDVFYVQDEIKFECEVVYASETVENSQWKTGGFWLLLTSILYCGSSKSPELSH